jgi:outer membrane protein assembly factor BamB
MRYVAALTLLLNLTSLGHADDWPQWMGPNRDGVWHEDGIVEAFPEAGLTVKWRVPIHLGYSGPTVVGDRVFVTDYELASGDLSNSPGRKNKLTGKERVVCLNAETGELIWKHEYDCPYEVSYPSGPRCTPAVAGNHVYTLGAEGNLVCLTADEGKVVWSKELKAEYQTKAPHWGFSGHPLIDGDRLYCLVGGKGSVVVAFNRHTGEELWKAISAKDAGYCPPSLITAGGVRQLILWDPEKINSLNPDTGEVYWQVPLVPDYDMSIVAPQQHGDYLFASAIGNVGALLKLDRDKPAASVVWKGDSRNAVYSANSTPLIVDNTIYGVCCRGGQLRGVDLLTGKRLWESFQPTTGKRPAGHGTAFLVRNADRFFLFSESGDLIVSHLSRSGYEEISRFHVLEPTGEAFGRPVVWTHPAFARRSVFARNDKEIVCVSLEK